MIPHDFLTKHKRAIERLANVKLIPLNGKPPPPGCIKFTIPWRKLKLSKDAV